ncbi:MAG: cold-shock protein [Alphaproteobacteria bacterium]
MHGTVRWFNPAKGYGFLAPADGGEDVFVRPDPGNPPLHPGAAVTFSIVQGPDGPEARHVVPGHLPDDEG